MASIISFHATADDVRIIDDAKLPGEVDSDVIRRALRLLAREAWRERAHVDAKRLTDEDLSLERDAWGLAPVPVPAGP